MTEYERLRLNEVVEQYVRSRSRTGTMVLPDCPLAGKELEDVILHAALRNGHSVYLDAA
jgi:hypothetical protein